MEIKKKFLLVQMKQEHSDFSGFQIINLDCLALFVYHTKHKYVGFYFEMFHKASCANETPNLAVY